MTRRIVVASLEAWDQVWRRNQYLVDGLLRADDDTEVLFVEPPADPLHEASHGRRPRAGAGLRTSPDYAGRLRLYQPTKLLPRAAGPWADALLRSGLRRTIARSGWDSGVLWINDPRAAGLVRGLGWPTLYDITDDWVEADRGSREHDRLRAADSELLRVSDEVVVCSRALLQTKGAQRPVHLVSNAVDVTRYRRPLGRPADLPDSAVALYVGTLHEDRLDVGLLGATATAVGAAGGTVVLVGPDALTAENRARIAGHPAVNVLGARPHTEVPGYLQHAHVLIVPHIVDAFTDSLDPIKLYEYLAVGRPIVSTPVSGFRDEPTATVASGAAFAEAAARAMADWTPTVEHADVPDWSARVADFGAVVDAALAGGSGGVRPAGVR